MILLAFDTSMAACSAAVYDTAAGRVLASAYETMERGHAEALPPMISSVMKHANVAFADLDRIAVTVGPGTFTGVRIGLSTARGLALARSTPIIGLTSLEAIKTNENQVDKPILVAADARLAEVYFSYFENSRIADFSAFRASLAETGTYLKNGPVMVIGTAADAVIASAGETQAVRSKAGDLPNATRFAALAANRQPGEKPPSPLYLKPADAKPQPQRVRISMAGAEAVPLLAKLHAASFDVPWTEQDFAALLGMPGTAAHIVTLGLGMEPVAFAVVRSAADEAEILTLATLPELRRTGRASALLLALKSSLGKEGIVALHIEVAARNTAAISLYRKSGFRESGRRKLYYALPDGKFDDAILMRLDLKP